MLNGILYILNMLLLFALFLSYASPYISPDTFLWPVALLGLIYPFLLLINVLFSIYWLIRFKKHFWVNTIVILLGYGHIQNLLNIQEKESDTKAEFSVMSFNVRLFNAYDWIKKENVKQEIIEYLNSEGYKMNEEELDGKAVRLVTAWNTTESEVDQLLDLISKKIN